MVFLNIEVQEITLKSGEQDMEIISLYIPPISKCTGSKIGDFNAHHDMYLSDIASNARENP